MTYGRYHILDVSFEYFYIFFVIFQYGEKKKHAHAD